MSWTISVPKTIRADFAAAIEAAVPNGQDDLPVERGEQVKAAKVAALGIAATALGDGDIVCSIYGHANPEHKKREGWSNDTVTVNVSVG